MNNLEKTSKVLQRLWNDKVRYIPKTIACIFVMGIIYLVFPDLVDKKAEVLSFSGNFTKFQPNRLRSHSGIDNTLLVFMAHGKNTSNLKEMKRILKKSRKWHVSFKAVDYTSEPGFKVQFWKKYLNPEVMKENAFIWLIDEDIRLGSDFDLDEYMKISRNSLISQPSLSEGVLYFKMFAQEKDLIARVALAIEVSTPIIRNDMWNLVYNQLLIETEASDHGIANRWCLLPLVYNSELKDFDYACLIVDALSVIHQNMQTAYERSKWDTEPASKPNTWRIAGLNDDIMQNAVWESMTLE